MSVSFIALTILKTSADEDTVKLFIVMNSYKVSNF